MEKTRRYEITLKRGDEAKRIWTESKTYWEVVELAEVIAQALDAEFEIEEVR